MPRDKKPKPQAETGNGPTGAAEPDTADRAGSSPKRVSKAHAVRTALAQGYEDPKDAVSFIKMRFGIAMERQQFSAYKSQLKKKAREAKSESRGTRRSTAIEDYLAPPSKPSAGADAGDSDLLAALETMKPLIDQYGAEKVKRIVDLLG